MHLNKGFLKQILGNRRVRYKPLQKRVHLLLVALHQLGKCGLIAADMAGQKLFIGDQR
jgi:hypothetical protein